MINSSNVLGMRISKLLFKMKKVLLLFLIIGFSGIINAQKYKLKCKDSCVLTNLKTKKSISYPSIYVFSESKDKKPIFVVYGKNDKQGLISLDQEIAPPVYDIVYKQNGIIFAQKNNMGIFDLYSISGKPLHISSRDSLTDYFFYKNLNVREQSIKFLNVRYRVDTLSYQKLMKYDSIKEVLKEALPLENYYPRRSFIKNDSLNNIGKIPYVLVGNYLFDYKQMKYNTISYDIAQEKVVLKVDEDLTKQLDSDIPFICSDDEFSFPAMFRGTWIDFLGNTVEYPEIAMNAGIDGRVVVKYLIDISGNVALVKAIEGPYELRAEAERTVRHSNGKWTPAKKCGRLVKAYGTQNISFKLE